MISMLSATVASANNKHAQITLSEPGTLEAKLTAAGFESVESLTISGTFGGADLNFLRERGPIVSNLSYLDMTNAVLTNDEVPYLALRYDYTENANFFCLSQENERKRLIRNNSKENTWYRNDLTYAFHYMDNLKVVKMPKTLTTIGALAFYQCVNLEEVIIPETVDSIGPWAFYQCRKIKQIKAPNVTKYGASCFRETGITSMNVPQGTKVIPSYMCGACPALTLVTIPSSVIEIGNGAFEGCYELLQVTLNEGLKSIKECAFEGAWRVASIAIPSTVEQMGNLAFGGQEWVDKITPEGGVIYLGKVAYKHTNETAKTVTIKEGTLGLADYLFADKSMLSVKFPSTLKVIGTSSLHNNAFTSITLPEGLEKIGAGSFQSCNRLTSITIPKSVKFIGDDAFRYDESLTEVTYNAENAKTYANYANIVDEAEEWQLSLVADIEKVLGEPYQGFYRVSNESAPYVFPSETLKKVTLGKDVKRIPYGLFNACTELDSIDLGGHVEYIGGSAFHSCLKLKSIDLTGVKEIGDQAFAQHEMSEIIIPASVKRIGDQAFRANIYYNNYPQKVYAYDTEPATIILQDGFDILDGNVVYDYAGSMYTSPATLYVPKGSKAKYEAASSWAKSFSSIEEIGEDGIDEITATRKRNSHWYTLEGMPINQPQRSGLYINAGRKVIIK
jgi:hypothetical protein